MHFPQRTGSHITESVSVDFLKSVLPKEWMVRKSSEIDYGVDYYVEICEGHSVVGMSATHF